MIEVKLQIPERAGAGEIVQIRTLALAPRLDDEAAAYGPDGLPIRVFREFRGRFEGRDILHATLQQGAARDLMLTFSLRVPGPGTLTLAWVLEDGSEIIRTHEFPA